MVNENEDVKAAVASNTGEVSKPSDDADNGLTFRDYWHMIVKNWIAVVIFVVLFASGGFVYGKAFKKAQWKCTGSVLVSVEDVTDTVAASSAAAGNISTTLTWVTTISDFLNGDMVLNAVTQDLISDGYNYSLSDTSKVDKLYSSSPRSSSGSYATSLYIDISGVSSDKTLSAKVVSHVLKEGQAIIDADYASHLAGNTTNGSWAFKRYYQVFFGSDYTKLSPTDASTSTGTITAVTAFVGLVIGVAFAIIKEVSSVYVVSKREIETLTGLKVIGLIPDYESQTNKAAKEGDK